MAVGHFLLESHNSMVTALGSCVEWPLVDNPFATLAINNRPHPSSTVVKVQERSWDEVLIAALSL
jgi:hypothetical protein